MNRAVRAIAPALALGLVLAACGGDDDATTPVDEPDAAFSEPDNSNDLPDDTTATTATTAPDEPADTVPGGVDKPQVEVPAGPVTELLITDLVEGSGEPLEAGDTVVAHYVGVLSADGTEFDESYTTGQPIEVQVGVGQVISGWDQGLLGAKAGGRRQIDIPAELAYGAEGAGDVIPPDSALTFVVDIVEVIKPPPPPTLAPAADASECPAVDGSSDQQQEFDAYPPTCIDPTKSYTAEVVTNHGTLEIALDAEQAPVTVNNFVTLARYHYFDDTECHRAIPGFMVQCGDPTGTGGGGPGYEFGDELPADASGYVPGAVAMANAGPDTNGSQFFIITGDASHLPPNYSLFGQVTEGLDDTVPALDALGNDDPAANGVPPLGPIVIESVTITES